jgi:hypothetical protein
MTGISEPNHWARRVHSHRRDQLESMQEVPSVKTGFTFLSDIAEFHPMCLIDDNQNNMLRGHDFASM